MPLYQVDTKGSDKPRVIDAKSEAAALKHAAAGQFTATLIKSPVAAAQLIAGGAAIETAGTPPPADPPALPDAAAIVEAAGILIADAGEPLTMDALFAKMLALPEHPMPDTPESRAAFDAAIGEAKDAGTLTLADEPAKGGGKK